MPRPVPASVSSFSGVTLLPRATWTWGPADAPDRITGSAGDFWRVVIQRLHADDTALIAEDERAAELLRLTQAFAGPPGMGRAAKRTGAS